MIVVRKSIYDEVSYESLVFKEAVLVYSPNEKKYVH